MAIKKKYSPPEIIVEALEAETNFALVCSNPTAYNTVGCLQLSAPVEYEMLVYGLDLTDDIAIDSKAFRDVAYSDDRSCIASCYQGPFDTVFMS